MTPHRIRLLATVAMAAALQGCGPPTPPDLRSEMGKAITALGMRPVYPLTETMRIGTVVMVDGAIGQPGSGLPAHQESSLLISEDFVPWLEQARRARFTLQEAHRFPKSPTGLEAALRPTTTGVAFYRQEADTAKKPVPEGAPSLVALPGYTLASVDQFSLGLFVPDAILSFFGALGLRNTSFMRVEAEGVEAAELPMSDLVSAMQAACREPIVRDQRNAQAVSLAYDTLAQQRAARIRNGARAAEMKPVLIMPRRVFYMRGIRFVIDNTRAMVVTAQAAVSHPQPAGVTAPGLPAININNNVKPPDDGKTPAGGRGEAETGNAARITAIQQQLDQLRTGLASGSNIQLAASFARATATGVELVQLFDRPLAFGYQPVAVDAEVTPGVNGTPTSSRGLAPLCDQFSTRY